MVETTLDLPIQADAEQAVHTVLTRATARKGVQQAALVALDGEGRIRAYVGGADYGAQPVRPRQPAPSARPARRSSRSST